MIDLSRYKPVDGPASLSDADAYYVYDCGDGGDLLSVSLGGGQFLGRFKDYWPAWEAMHAAGSIVEPGPAGRRLFLLVSEKPGASTEWLGIIATHTVVFGPR